MDRRYDPRSIVTPYAFSVHPDLLGRPLATPWQRLGAILVDLLLIAVLSNAIPGILLAVASGLLLFWLAVRKPGRDVLGKLFRVFVGCLGVGVLGIALLVYLGIRYSDDLEEWGGEAAQELAQEAGIPLDSLEGGGPPGLRDVLEVVSEAAAFRGVTSREEAQAISNRLARNAMELGLSRQEIRSSLESLIPEEAPWAGDAEAIVEEAMANLPRPPAPGRASAEAEAVDSLPSAPERLEEAAAPGISDPLAQDSIETLNQRLLLEQEARVDAETEALEARRALEEEESQGIFQWLYNLIDELGLGFGWFALYVTITHAWWKGTSVGKRLFRIRVVMIDQRPLTWWLSFERAGGYAAGFATGLLGFAQVFWDPNRQAIHDKVSETIVIQDGKPPVPGPWIEEGKALWRRGRPFPEDPHGETPPR